MLKMIILPRQARDKHRGNSKKEGVSYRTPADRVLFVLLLIIIIIIIIIISLLA